MCRIFLIEFKYVILYYQSNKHGLLESIFIHIIYLYICDLKLLTKKSIFKSRP